MIVTYDRKNMFIVQATDASDRIWTLSLKFIIMFLYHYATREEPILFLLIHHFLSHGASGRIQAINIRIVCCLFYHSDSQALFFFLIRHFLSHGAGDSVWSLNLRFISWLFCDTVTQPHRQSK